jgi:pimeloyl-ACP methyl ester carboxylesterase
MSEMKILFIHGVGHKEENEEWQSQWLSMISEHLKQHGSSEAVTPKYFKYDQKFVDAGLGADDWAEALVDLAGSGIYHWFGDLFAGRRAFGDDIRWKAGMVAQWTADEDLRDQLCDDLETSINSFRPNIVCAHSLGSLIAYDLFLRQPGLMQGRTFITLGSQIAHPCVRSTFGGDYPSYIEGAKAWFHLFNPDDHVFTAPITINDNRFEQITVTTHPSREPHEALNYFEDPNTDNLLWQRIAQPAAVTPRSFTSWRATQASKKPRALLVGINNYPDPANRLEGCVNDVYLMSSVLQEQGFQPENIRLLLNERATAKEIMNRMEWLLEGATENSPRFFFYSGHGAQIPEYGQYDDVDHLDECLVAYDFDWTRDRAVTDDWFLQFYSQLSYAANFTAMFDCCHSGGMTRDGAARVRGLSAPDDIRHRVLRWDEPSQMWLPRELGMSERKLLKKNEKDSEIYLGSAGSTKRLGRAVSLWSDAESFAKAKKKYAAKGPYMPVLLEACQESEYSYEYRNGVTTYGAFTYSLASILRMKRQKKQSTHFVALMKEAAIQVEALGYQQHPVLACPAAKKNTNFPSITTKP